MFLSFYENIVELVIGTLTVAHQEKQNKHQNTGFDLRSECDMYKNYSKIY